MRLNTYGLIGLYFLLSGNLQAISVTPSPLSHNITKKNLRAHVNFLSSDALEGRLTGSAGEKLATDYVATIFRHLGLEPAGDNGTFFQEFNFTTGVSLGKNNTLEISNEKGLKKHLILNKDWRPLSFSDTLSFQNMKLIFAGYGITAPALGKLPPFDSYRNLTVKNKWVVVFRSIPKNITAEQHQQIKPYSSLRYKVFTAKEHGAKGIIFVSSAHLIPLSYDTSLSNSGIAVLSIKSSQAHLNGMTISGQTEIIKINKQGRNVLAKLKFSSSEAPMIVIGAHLDHLGYGTLGGSRGRGNETEMIHPGADDNASGVASMLEAAIQLTYLKVHGKQDGNKDILFAAWSGEEFGVLGSSHFLTTIKKTMANNSLDTAIDAVINLDMVGHLRKNLVLQGTGSSNDWLTLINQVKIKHPLSLIIQTDPYLPTDSTPFYLNGVPTLNFFTGAHDDYHTPRDRPETLNYDGIKKISNFMVDLILALVKKPNAMKYAEVQKNHDNTEQELTIYLGTIPDYASSIVSGVKLSGVAKDSPASKAGMRQGDVVIKLAGKPIHDIYDYTFALNLLTVGEPVKLVVLRQQKEISLTITPRYRGSF